MTTEHAPPLRVGIIGFGFIGQTHTGAYRAAAAAGAPVQLVAVADRAIAGIRDGKQTEGNLATGSSEAGFDLNELECHEDAAGIFGDPTIDLISICTPTTTHVDLAIQAMEAGKHVLVEKPVALTSDEVQRLATAAAASDRTCMPAMCIRFWPAWAWLKDRVVDGSLGSVRTARFERVGGPPGWSPEFYLEESRSGGAILDLHVHDVDFITYVFGLPSSVHASGSTRHVLTTYRYEDGPEFVSALGGWINSSTYPFTMRYVVEFETGVADFDLSREQQLMWYDGTDEKPIDVGDGDGYVGQIKHLASVLRGTTPTLSATVSEAVDVTRLIDAERRSLAEGRPIKFSPNH